MKTSSPLAVVLALAALALPACHKHAGDHAHHGHNKIVVTSPKIKDVVLTQPYVCQIRAQKHIEIRPMVSGYLKHIGVTEGQRVEEGDELFKVLPVLYKAKLDAEKAEVDLAEIEFRNTKKLNEQKVVSVQEVMLYQAKLSKAEARLKLAEAEMQFTTLKAPFPGVVDRLQQQLGSLVKESDVLTTLSDTRVMWVYFNVPEARYLGYMAAGPGGTVGREAELVLANGSHFQYPGRVAAIEGIFDNTTGNIQFRADFPNPSGLLRHGQTGTVLLRHRQHDAVVVPQRATFEVLDKRYVFVVDKDNVARQREVTVQHEQEDVYVIGSGLAAGERFVVEGGRDVHDGEKIEYEFRAPDEVLPNQKFHAE